MNIKKLVSNPLATNESQGKQKENVKVRTHT